MKQFLRLCGSYGLKRTQSIRHIHPQSIPDKWNTNTRNSRTRSSFPRTFFALSSAISRESIGLYAARMRENYTYASDTPRVRQARWANKAKRKSGDCVSALGKAQPIPCSSPPSLIPHPCDIPMIPVYISIKRPKYGTLPKGIRQTYGRKAHSKRQRIALGADRGRAGDRLESASEIGLSSELTCSALVRRGPNQGTTKSKPSANQGTTELRSHTKKYPAANRNALSPLAAWGWFEYSRALVRQLLTIASAFFRSVVEGLSKDSRTSLEALSKDCRTSLEQQSNTPRRNTEESCVCTHAKVPARSGLGLALGMTLFFLLAWFSGLYAQPSTQREKEIDSIAPLQIGDTIPEVLWHLPLQVVDHPEGRDAITLDDYRGKLVILDFWSTWCSGCVAGMPKMNLLKREFGQQAAMVYVTYQKRSIVEAFEKRNALMKNNQLPVVVNDILLKKWFPHKFIPHVIWIGRDGIVTAITPPEYLIAENIQQVIDGNNVGWLMKNDRGSLGETSIFDVELSAVKDGSVRGYAGIAGCIPGGAIEYREVADTVSKTRRITITNYPVIRLYKECAGPIPENRIVWEVADPSHYRYKPSYGYFNEWILKHGYCYESVSALADTLVKERMRQDINRFLSLHGRWEVRNTPCLVLRKSGSLRIPLESKDGGRGYVDLKGVVKKIRNRPMASLIACINDASAHPVIDDTQIPATIDIDLAIDSLSDIAQLQDALKPYGLRLDAETRDIKMFVLTETANR